MRRHGDLPFGAAAMLLALAAAVLLLRMWEADLSAPFEYTGDATLNLTLVKDVLKHPWYFENSDLGAPHGQELYDYPVVNGDTLNVALFRIAGLTTDNPALVMNLFFLFTFPITALLAFLVLRRLPVSPCIALVCALLYTLLPYHFMRGEDHLLLSAYYAVPLGAYLVISVLEGRTLFGRRRRTLLTVAICVVVGAASGSFYYAAFTVLLVAVATALRFIAVREPRTLAVGGMVVGLIAAVLLVQLTPTIVYRIGHGTNGEVANRSWHESEYYGLNLTNLVLPVDDHRIGVLARLKNEYTAQIPPTEGRTATLGLVGTVGFLWLLAVAVAACAGAGRRYRLGMHGGLAAVTVVAFMIATTGGLATLIAAIWPQIRSWNRISVFIAFFSLAAVALLLEALRRMLERRRASALVFPLLLIGVLAIGVADQTTSRYVPAYDRVADAYRGDREFADSLEARLPEGASVVQLPYEPFPEPPLGGRPPYEPAKQYLHSDNLRWSYGAMRGRPDDWAATIADKPAPEVVRAARSEGFAGILLDRTPYPDNGAAMEAGLRQVLNGEPWRSPTGRLLFWSL